MAAEDPDDAGAEARTLSEGFALAVARHGAAAAVVTGEGAVMTYADLDRRARTVTGALVDAGIGPGSAVLVEGVRAPGTIAVLLGVLAAGAAYVPVDPDWPTARIEQIATIAGADLALLDRDGVLGATASAPLGAATTPGRPLTPATTGPAVGTRPDGDDPGASDAYIIFTSGSTGTPKGVRVSHRAVLSLLRWFWSVTTRRERRLSATSTSLSFDPSVLEVFGPLLSGGAVKAVRSVWESATGHGDPTFMASTPAVLRTLVDTRRLPAGLELLVSGGEAMTPTLARDLLAARPGLRLWNAYGPTEATVLVTMHEVRAPVPDRIPVGRPTAGTEIRLLDPGGEVLASAVAKSAGRPGAGGGTGAAARGSTPTTGEIGVLGAQLASGYVAPGDEDGVFVSVPGADGAAVRMYRTGDRGRLDADGVLWFSGRIDAQLKVRGHRIEPGEVEAALLALDGVREARVAAAGDGGGRRLVAHVLARPGLTGEELRDRLRARLPEHLVPSHVTVGGELPLTSSGKVDAASIADTADAEQRSRNVRAAAAAATDADADADAGQRSRNVRTVAALVTEVLGAPAVHPDDDFLGVLGGTSLQLVTLLGELERRFALEVRLDEVVRDTTVRGLARLVTGPVATGDGPAGLVDLRPFDRPERPRPRVFLIHAYFGGMLRYQRLRQRLAARWDVVLVDAQMAGHGTPPCEDVTALAGRAQRIVVATDPTGPYALVGHSAGGLVALELARALSRDGRGVSYLGLVDSPRIGARWEFVWSEVAQNLPELPRLLAPASLRARFGRSSSPPSPIGAAIDRTNRSTNRAVRTFRPLPYPGDAVLFSTREGRRMAHGRDDLGWGGHLGSIEHHLITGGHVSALDDPHVATLARLLDESLRRQLDAGTGPGPSPHPTDERRWR